MASITFALLAIFFVLISIDIDLEKIHKDLERLADIEKFAAMERDASRETL